MNNCQVDEDMDGYSTLSDINDTNPSLYHMSINLEGLHTENFGVLFWQVSDISDGDNLTGGGDTIGHAIPEPYDEPNEMRALAQFRCGCANPTVDAHAFYFFAPYHFENIPNLIDETYANSIPGLNVPNYVYDPNTPSGYAKGVSTDGFDHLITTLQHQGKSIANVIIDASGPYTLGLDRENTEWTFDLNTGVEVRHYEPSLGTQVSIKINHTKIIHLGSPIVTLTLHHNAAHTLADDTVSMVYNIPNAALSIADRLNDDMNILAHAFIDAIAGRDLRITISAPTPLISAFELDNNVDLEYLRNTTDQSKRVVEVYNLPNFKIETIDANN